MAINARTAALRTAASVAALFAAHSTVLARDNGVPLQVNRGAINNGVNSSTASTQQTNEAAAAKQKNALVVNNGITGSSYQALQDNLQHGAVPGTQSIPLVKGGAQLNKTVQNGGVNFSTALTQMTNESAAVNPQRNVFTENGGVNASTFTLIEGNTSTAVLPTMTFKPTGKMPGW